MDNASAHRNERIKTLVNKHNNILYAVPYQHFTNSIENYFSMLKSRLQKLDGLKYENLKENIQNLDERSAAARAAGNTQRQPQVVETITRDQPKIGRNDRVTIKHVMSGEKKTTKYKQAEPLIAKGEWVLVQGK